MDKTSLGDRMKGYEKVTSSKLLRRTPVIIRLDGKAFHTFTKRLKHIDKGLEDDPFSDVMRNCMVGTMNGLVRNTQNAVLGYTQSDEISILLRDWDTLTTDQWFGGSIQKIVSISASMASVMFNRAYAEYELIEECKDMPLFDARVFNLPKEEVVNYFLWRQQDASRNSVQMLGRHYFSHKQLHKKSVSNIQDMLHAEHGVNWNDLDTWKKRGTCAEYRREYKSLGKGGPDGTWEANYPAASKLITDRDIPIFSQDRNYIEKHLEIL